MTPLGRRLFVLAVAGCGNAADDPPAPVCRDPGETPLDWFVEVTEEVGLGTTAEVPPVATSVVAADVNHDGWIDFFASVFPSQREPDPAARTRFLFLNQPDPQDPSQRVFVDALDDSGLLETRDGEGGRGITTVTFGDLDNDGDTDAVGCPAEISTTILDGCAAFANDGDGRFTLVDGGALEQDLFSVPTSVLLDYDLDGILDFWPGTIGEWQYGPAATSAPRLFRGNGDGTFRDVSEDVGLPTTLSTASDFRMTFGLTSCDLDLDGDRDVLVGSYGVPIGPNHVWRNDDGVFTDIADEIGVEKEGLGGFTFSITCGDLEDDGDQDLMTSEVSHPGQGTDTSAVLVNGTRPGRELNEFERMDDVVLGITRAPGDKEGDNLAFFEDVDLDGRKDILVLGSNYPQQFEGDDEYTHPWLFHQTDDLVFEDETPRTPWGRPKHQTLEGGALADIDNDGDLDLVVGTGLFNSQFIAEELGITTSALHVYRNMVGQNRNWTRIRLVGTGEDESNVSGIGAVVSVTAGGRTQHREVLGSWGHSNTQTDTWLTFGLGSSCEIDAIDVTWPDQLGVTSHHVNVLANYAIEIVEGDQDIHYLD